MNALIAGPAAVDMPDAAVHAASSMPGAHAAAQVAPLRLPALSRAAARAARTIGDTRFAAFVRERLGAACLDVRVIDTDDTLASAPGFEDPAVVEIALSTHDAAQSPTSTLQIALNLRAWPSLAIAAWFDAPTPGAGASVSDDAAQRALRNAVAGVLLEPLLTRLGHALACDARLVAVRRARLRAGVQIAMSFVTGTQQRHPIYIAPGARTLDLLDARLRDASAGAEALMQAQDYPSVAVPGSLIVGVKPLAVQTLRTLEAGDVLLRALFPSWTAGALATAGLVPPADAAPARPRALAAWGTPGLARLVAVVEIDGHAPVIIKEPNMSEELDPASAYAGLAVDHADNPIHIGELELPVQFEIDTVALPLAQLSTLGPGYVVELSVPVADARLRLVAHGQTIGYGELVTVGEHLGIRIIRMAHRHGPVQ